MDEQRETRIMMTVLVLVWGTAFVSIKVLGQFLDPVQLTWYRYVPFLIVFGIWLPVARRGRLRSVTGPDWLRFTAAGALGVLGYHLPLNYGTSDLTPGEPVTGGMAAVFVATTPLWTLLWVAIGGQERVTRRKLLGAATAFIGVAVVVFLGRPDADGPDAVSKALIVMLAPILWSLYNIVAKPLAGTYGGLFTAALTNGIGALALVPIGLRYGFAPLRALDGVGWFWLAYLSLAATVGGYIVWNRALKVLSPARVTSYIFAVPVVATLAGAILIQEPVTLWFVLGAGLVIFGLAQIQRVRPEAA